MRTDNSELLACYLREKSEECFAELVRQNIDLVYSAALRQVNGDTSAAEDVTQAVFTDLARKAPHLARHSSLTGWLYTSTRYLAAKARRAEQRRRVREEKAHAMTQLIPNPTAEPNWEELRPVLDEVMHGLSTADREAVLMRYFEGRALNEIGTRLGLSENAARMRVERALDRLRAELARRGVTSTAAALGIALAQRAVGAAPAGLSVRVSKTAFASAASAGGIMATVAVWLGGMKAQVIAAAAVGAVLLGTLLWLNQSARPGGAIAGSSAEQNPQIGSAQSGNVDTAKAMVADVPTSVGQTNGSVFELQIVAADSEKPVPNVGIEYWTWQGDRGLGRQNLQADRFGLCEVPVQREKATHFIVVAKSDGFAETRLEWRTDRGEKIPSRYLLKLARAVSIGGSVVDADGKPVGGAEVGFNNQTDPAVEGDGPQTDNFGWPFWITAVTDGQGRWKIDRIGKAALKTIYGSASHPEHVHSEMLWAGRDGEGLKRLLDGSYVFRLGGAVSVRGVVTDPDGAPIDGAKVLVGNRGEGGSREGTTQTDGTFFLAGCKPGENLITAEAKNFAPATLKVQLTQDTQPVRITLQLGKLLRMRVLNKAGEPVAKAGVWLDTFDHGPVSTRAGRPARSQVEFNRKTDADGRLEWDEAPDQELTFNISAKGYMEVSGIKLTPDGTEHVITLATALTISGTVRDAATGKDLSRFRVATGWPEWDPISNSTNAHWSTIDRFWLTFEGGKFRHVFEEPVLNGTPNPGFIFKIEADGYLPEITRAVAFGETDARFDVALRPAKQTTITVLTPDGTPAADADVGFVGSGSRLEIRPGGLVRDQGIVAGNLASADKNGGLKLPADEGLTRVIAAHASGYAEVAAEVVRSEGVIQLQRWGRIEGTYTTNRRTVEPELLLEYAGGTSGAQRLVSFDYAAFRVKPDAQGRFVFPQVPAGKHRLVRLVPEKTAPGMVPMAFTHQLVEQVEVRAGETSAVSIAGPVARVTARLGWPAGMNRGPGYNVQFIMHTVGPQPPDDVKQDRNAVLAWSEQPEIKAALAKMRVVRLGEEANGAFASDEVPPGQYVLRATVLDTSATPPRVVATAQSMVNVPASSTDTVDSGEIQLSAP